MYKYIHIDGIKVDFFCTIERDKATANREGKTWVDVVDKYGFHKLHYLSVYYRHERTWDDHMGNTPCGYYVNLPLPNGKRVRVYMY